MALAIDGSTPAIATNAVGTVAALTTASFTPPAGSVLLVLWSGDALTAPSAPAITDSLGAHLTYTPTDWKSQADAPTVFGQAAAWTAVVATSAAMTVTVTSGSVSGERTAALCVIVLTGADTTTPAGAHGKSGSASAASIAQSYTAQSTGGWGFISVCDFDAIGVETAGTGCTIIGSALVGSNFDYGFGRRTTADDSNGGSNSLNVTLPGTSTNLCWVYVEINPAPTGAADSPNQPPLATRPSAWQGPPFLVAPWRQLLPVTDPGPAPINAPQTLLVSTSTPPAATNAFLSSNPSAPVVVSTSSTPNALVVSPPFAPVPVPGANISASQPLGNPAIGTPGPAVVGPQFRWPLPTPAIITAGPVQPGAPRALVVTPPWTPVYIPPVSITVSQPLGNPAVPTPPAIVVTPPPWRLTTQPRLFGPGAPAAVVSTTATSNALVVSPTFAWPLVPLNFTSASQPLGNPAVGTPQPLVVSTPWSAKVPGVIITGNPAAPVVPTTGTPNALVVTTVTPPAPTLSRLFAGSPTTASAQPVVVSIAPAPYIGHRAPGAKLFANVLVPPAQRTFSHTLIVSMPWVSDRGAVRILSGYTLPPDEAVGRDAPYLSRTLLAVTSTTSAGGRTDSTESAHISQTGAAGRTDATGSTYISQTTGITRTDGDQR
jgi:hypothetical protein